MKLFELLENVEYKTSLSDVEITGVTSDSRQFESGNVFVCIKGINFDGHDIAEDMIKKGAVAVVTERDLGIDEQILVPDSKIAFGIICGNYFGNPARKMKMAAVTGTNGKSTTVFLLKQILESMGKKTGLISTIDYEIGDKILPSKNTTPDAYTLNSMLAKMYDSGCEYVVMEASSHALDQHRLSGIIYDVGIFTNLSIDHMDYHKTMENYFLAKKKLFDISKRAIVNYDDEYGRRLKDELSDKAVTISICDDNADFTAKNIKYYPNGSKFAFVGKNMIARMETNIPGEYSVSNIMGVIVCCLEFGFDINQISAATKHLKGVSGRLEVIYSCDDFTVIRDYAHAADALEKTLSTMKKFVNGRLVTLFGCAGCRDRKKRKEMGRAVMRNSDFAILTSDNPREEDPMQIINDTIIGMDDKNRYKVMVDRYDAIKWAVDNIQKGDTLILTGKGHEDYQVFDFGSVYFNEKELVIEFLEKAGKI